MDNKNTVILLLCVFIVIYATHYNNEYFKKTIIDKSTKYSDVINYIKYYNIYDSHIDSTKIPKIIIQTWKSDYIPNKYIDDIKSIKKYNKDYTFIFFNDDDIKNFLLEKYPYYYDIYNKLPIVIQKIDFFRYVAIYHYGGFYFDLDITCLAPLDKTLGNKCIFPIDMHLRNCGEQRYTDFCSKNQYILLGQYAFASTPRNLFIKNLIEIIAFNIEMYIKKKDNSELYVYRTTGPDFVTLVYMEYPNQKDIHILYHNENQYFGIYAKHNHFGTWK